MIAFMSAIPVLAPFLFAGVRADPIDRRRLQVVTQTTAAMLALTLAVLTALGSCVSPIFSQPPPSPAS
jgi:hypothetical protein